MTRMKRIITDKRNHKICVNQHNQSHPCANINLKT